MSSLKFNIDKLFLIKFILIFSIIASIVFSIYLFIFDSNYLLSILIAVWSIILTTTKKCIDLIFM
jgi:hypothetical protein